MKKLVLLIATFVYTVNLNAQSTLKTLTYGLDATIGAGIIAPSLQVSKNFSLKKAVKTKFGIGFGVRYTMVRGSNSLEYITAPAILTTGKKGPGVFFADQIPTNMDTFSYAKTSANALNLMLAFRYRLARKIAIEFNIDAIGFSYGKEQVGTLKNPNTTFPIVKAKPTSINALLIGDNDLGTLNSQFNFQYAVNPKITAKAGVGFVFTEYTNDTNLVVNNAAALNDRFRNKSLGFLFGVQYNFLKPIAKPTVNPLQ
jgi:hypothetical protein